MSGALVPWRSSFLQNLRETGGNVKRSAELAGVTRIAVYRRAARDRQFRIALRLTLAEFPNRNGVKSPPLEATETATQPSR